VDHEKLGDGFLGETLAEERLDGGAHGAVEVGHERAGHAGDGDADVVIGAQDGAEVLDAGYDVLVEAAREDVGVGGEQARLDPEREEEVELGANGAVGIEGEQQRVTTHRAGDIRVGEAVLAQEGLNGVSPGCVPDADLASGGDGGGDTAGNQVGDRGGAGLAVGRRLDGGRGGVTLREEGARVVGVDGVLAAGGGGGEDWGEGDGEPPPAQLRKHVGWMESVGWWIQR